MHSSTFTNLALAALIAGPASVLADSCPDGTDPEIANNTPVCCKGVVQITTGNQINCLAGCSQVFPSCFPQCPMTTSGSCTTVPVTASDYTQRVYGSGSDGGSATITSVSQGGAAAIAGPVITSPPRAVAVGAALAGLALL